MAATAQGTRAGLGRFLVVALVILGLVLAPGASGAPRQSTERAAAPQLATPTGVAKQLVDRFFALLVDKNRAGLQRFLSPAFQVQRADGSGAGKQAYLANLATIQKFGITQVHATRARNTLVVRYLADVEGVVNGRPYTPGPAPRLSVFTRNANRWQLIAHANFNPLNG
jgi:hypothetical protein